MHIKHYTYSELSAGLLYQILQLRQMVFVVEQDCPYLDADGLDEKAVQVVTMRENEVIGCARILPQGSVYEDAAAIGRIATHPNFRSQGIGQELIEYCIAHIRSWYGNIPIKMGAQTYLLEWYQKMGFVPEGPAYLEDDIPHQHLVLRPSEGL